MIIKKNTHSFRWITLIGLGLALIVINVDVTIVNLALPILGQTFHAKLPTLQWVVNSYSMTCAGLIIIAGKLADCYGYRFIYLCGITCFLMGSLIAGFAPIMNVIILGRILQGVGMASTYSLVFILTSHIFSSTEQKSALGLLVAFVGISQAIGPTLGGLIIQHWGWRWAFLVNAPICFISFILVYFFCQTDAISEEKKIHYSSALLLTATYVIIISILNNMSQLKITLFELVIIIGFSAIVFSSVIIWQRKLRYPLLHPTLLKNKNYCILIILRCMLQFTLGGLFLILPIYLQNIIGLSPGINGYVMLLMTSMLALSSIFIGYLGRYLSSMQLILYAYILAVVSFGIFAIIPMIPIPWLPFSLALILMGITIGFIFAGTTDAMMNSLPIKYQGVGYGFFMANAFFCYSIGIAISGHLLTLVGFSNFNHIIALHFGKYSNLFNNMRLESYVNGAKPLVELTKLYPQQAMLLKQFATAAYAQGFRAVMYLFFSCSVFGCLLTIFLMRKKRQMNTHVNR